MIRALGCGLAQVMLQENPWTGLCFLAGIVVGAWQLDFWGGIRLVVGLMVGTAAGLRWGELSKVHQGIYGYNGALVGIALPILLPNSWYLWAWVVWGAVVSVWVHLALEKALQRTGMRVLTAPFVIVTGRFAR